MPQRKDLLRETRFPGRGVRTAFGELGRRVDEALIETLPASDAPSWALGIESANQAGEIEPLGAVKFGELRAAGWAATRAQRRKGGSHRAERRAVVLTIGHSTRSAAELIALLKARRVEVVVDVRTIPRSRTNPQFNSATLQRELEVAGVGYRHAPALGGLRRAKPDSANGGWHNASFRGFADYMQTPEFASALEALVGQARAERLALMCAEAVPWRCHRSLIADALAVRGLAVEHIIGPGETRSHALTPWALVKGTAIVYPTARARRYEATRARQSSRGNGRC